MPVSQRWGDGLVRSRPPGKGARPIDPSRAPVEGCSARAGLAPEDSAGADLRRRASPGSFDKTPRLPVRAFQQARRQAPHVDAILSARSRMA